MTDLGALGTEALARYRAQVHPLFIWLDGTIRHPVMLAPAAAILGPDLAVWNMNGCVRKPGDRVFFSRHQDRPIGA